MRKCVRGGGEKKEKVKRMGKKQKKKKRTHGGGTDGARTSFFAGACAPNSHTYIFVELIDRLET